MPYVQLRIYSQLQIRLQLLLLLSTLPVTHWRVYTEGIAYSYEVFTITIQLLHSLQLLQSSLQWQDQQLAIKTCLFSVVSVASLGYYLINQKNTMLCCMIFIVSKSTNYNYQKLLQSPACVQPSVQPTSYSQSALIKAQLISKASYRLVVIGSNSETPACMQLYRLRLRIKVYEGMIIIAIYSKHNLGSSCSHVYISVTR